MSAWQRDRNYNWSAGSTGSSCLHAQSLCASCMHEGPLTSTSQDTELVKHSLPQAQVWLDLSLEVRAACADQGRCGCSCLRCVLRAGIHAGGHLPGVRGAHPGHAQRLCARGEGGQAAPQQGRRGHRCARHHSHQRPCGEEAAVLPEQLMPTPGSIRLQLTLLP